MRRGAGLERGTPDLANQSEPVLNAMAEARRVLTGPDIFDKAFRTSLLSESTLMAIVKLPTTLLDGQLDRGFR